MDKNLLIKPAADEIADMADRGEDISQYFNNEGRMKSPALQHHRIQDNKGRNDDKL